jgi:hypothetical protein
MRIDAASATSSFDSPEQWAPPVSQGPDAFSQWQLDAAAGDGIDGPTSEDPLASAGNAKFPPLVVFVGGLILSHVLDDFLFPDNGNKPPPSGPSGAEGAGGNQGTGGAGGGQG